MFGVITTEAKVDPQVAAFDPAELGKPVSECRQVGLRPSIIRRSGNEHPDPPHYSALLRPRNNRPTRRAAEKRDEVAAPNHSITSSARASSDGGTVMPSALAVLRLMTSSNLAGCSTGKSPGFSPLRMRPTYTPACRWFSAMGAP